MNNVNSFSENLAELTKNTKEILAYAEGVNEAMVGTDTSIVIGDDIVLPSFNNIVNRVERVEKTVETITKGIGSIEIDDGSYRKLKIDTVSKPPIDVSYTLDVSTFDINSNWFFEELQYPKCIIKLNLKDQIEDDSDRVYVNRIILDTKQTLTKTNLSVIDFYLNNIKDKNLTYTELISLLETYDIKYAEDKEEISLPLTYEKYYGKFEVTDSKLLKNSNSVSVHWLYLDTLSYSLINENNEELANSYVLTTNDTLRFNNSLYKIAEINQTNKRIHLEYTLGYDTIGVGDVLEFYNEPFREKIVNVGIGIDEINILYIKGVNENYNLLSKNWSNPITFYTNELIRANGTETFENYYNINVADFGKSWIAQAKEKQIYAYNGLTPNVPTINADDLQVVQINTQLDATLDKERYNNLTTEISSTKSNITATRNTISSNKDRLIASTDATTRTSLQNLINTDTETLNSLTTQYNSLVEELNTLLNESGVINYSPKYHIRGFFNIPEPRYLDEPTNTLGEQDIIGFDIMYRYLHTDETGIKLNTYEYAGENNTIQTGVFTDWNIVTSSILNKVYDDDLQAYVWEAEDTADGTQININQIDIPIRKGEKVEIKVRSISEAGYPSNPLKSDWSSSVIISFPENLTSDDSVTTIIDGVKNDMTAVVLQETMSAAGVYTHLSDSNSSYKHDAVNLSITIDDKTQSLYDVITDLKKKIESLENA